MLTRSPPKETAPSPPRAKDGTVIRAEDVLLIQVPVHSISGGGWVMIDRDDLFRDSNGQLFLKPEVLASSTILLRTATKGDKVEWDNGSATVREQFVFGEAGDCLPGYSLVHPVDSHGRMPQQIDPKKLQIVETSLLRYVSW